MTHENLEAKLERGGCARARRSRRASAVGVLGVAGACALAAAAHAQSKTAVIYAGDFGGARLQDSEVSHTPIRGGCELRLEFNPSPGSTKWAIKEVSDDRGQPQRPRSPGCATRAEFRFSEARNKQLFEDQTAYYWTKVAREYAIRRLWITPRGLPAPPKLAFDAVQPNVLSQGSFNNACIFRGGNPGCMKVWPHEGPKLHFKEGWVKPEIVAHEFGHYAAGYVFGHMDITGFTVPAIFADCAKLAFQEAAAEMFAELALHDVRYSSLAGAAGHGVPSASERARWPVACGQEGKSEYDTAAPLVQAFKQSLWGADATNTIKVNWRPTASATSGPNSAEVANKTMADAFVYALSLNRGQRVDFLATDVLKWIAANEPLRSREIVKVFESHGFAQQLGTSCTEHLQCASQRCDNRPGAGCVAPDGQAQPAEFCTTHQQCKSQYCSLAPGRISGTCSAAGRKLGDVCVTHAECASQRCDNRPGAGCVAPDGQAQSAEFCTTHQQCKSQHCNLAVGRISGVCTSSNRKLGEACATHAECASQRCDNRPGAGCVAYDGRAEVGEFCTTHQQCRSQFCNVAPGKGTGLCASR